MFAKKGTTPSSSDRVYRKELEYLYTRRSTIDALIASLEQYDRFRARNVSQIEKRKSA